MFTQLSLFRFYPIVRLPLVQVGVVPYLASVGMESIIQRDSIFYGLGAFIKFIERLNVDGGGDSRSLAF